MATTREKHPDGVDPPAEDGNYQTERLAELLVVVPGSHRLDIVCPEKADPTLYFTSDHVPVPEGLEAVPLTLNAGDMLFFNGSLIQSTVSQF